MSDVVEEQQGEAVSNAKSEQKENGESNNVDDTVECQKRQNYLLILCISVFVIVAFIVTFLVLKRNKKIWVKNVRYQYIENNHDYRSS